jgi:uncharacterized protein
MSKITDRVKDIVLSYVNVLKLHGCSVGEVYLFSSQAKGTAIPESDIDLILVSTEFSEMPMWKRWEILGDAISEVMEPIHVI